ncbi:MAG: quinone oxidoreductase, partial [Hyphomicrobiales bacterium]|nr:quinone oxidoreductase [Hyphomicrobiales bacterium]
IGVNYIDVYDRTGLYPLSSLPAILGREAAGDVASVGRGVKGFKPGDRVAYVSGPGAYAEARNIAAAAVVKLPKSVSYETAAAAMLKGMTAQYLLRSTYRVKKGDTILVHAAAGGTGLILCQWGKALGATVIGTVGSDAKAKLAKKAGAKHVIDYTREDFAVRVAEITKGAKCAAVYDGVGRTTFLKSLDCLRPFGTMASFGSASGAVEPFDIGILGRKGSLYVTRPTLFTHIADISRLQAMARDMFRAIASGAVTIPVHSRLPLAKVADAHRALESRATTGATILLP